MTSKNDGGPAFPLPALAMPNNYHVPEGWEGCDGMSLRDWFAGQALSQLATMNASWPVNLVPEYCYRIADAMIAERAK